MDNKTAIKIMLCEMVAKSEDVKTQDEIETLTNNIADRIVKLLDLHIVTQQSEPFLAFLDYIQESQKDGETITDNEMFVKGFLKAKYGG